MYICNIFTFFDLSSIRLTGYDTTGTPQWIENLLAFSKGRPVAKTTFTDSNQRGIQGEGPWLCVLTADEQNKQRMPYNKLQLSKTAVRTVLKA